MTNQHSSFRRILLQNLALPLVLGLVSAGIFVGLVLYLLESSGWVAHTDQVIMSAARLQSTVLDAETALRGFYVTREDRFLVPFELARDRSPAEFKALINLVSDNPIQVERAQRIEANFNLWLSYAERALQKVNDSNSTLPAKTLAEFAQEGKTYVDDFRRRFTEFISQEEGLRISRTVTTEDFARSLLAIVVIISLAIAGLVAWLGRKQLTGLSSAYESMIQKHQDQNARLVREHWFEQGRNRLGQNLIGQSSLNAISDRILQQLTEFLGAELGSFFVADRAGQGLFQKVTSLGLTSEDAKMRQGFKTGEGLLGSAIRDKKVQVLKDLPPDYFRIQTGLGETTAKSVVIFPIMTGDEVNSAIELGFLHNPDEKTVSFLEQNGRSIGMAVQSVRYREQLEELLTEVQSQTEELQAQQEEMRVSNEELEEQTRLLREAQARSDAQNAELEQTNSQLEEQAQLLEEQKNLLDRRNEELTRTRRDIENKASELSKASHYKSEFLANMSHELRTPLNSALILSQLLSENRNANLTSQQVEYANQITKCGKDLLLLINDVLDISKVESGKMDVTAEEFGLDSLLKSLSTMFKPQANQKQLEFVVSNLATSKNVTTDRLRLEQILKNLISNAIKFTEKGEVRVSVQNSKIDATKLVFSVEDTGIGIQEENLDLIFEAFRQADGTTSRKYGGTGLGLSISKELARLLGGEIRVESNPSRGSHFHLEIPVEFQGEVETNEIQMPPDLRANEVSRLQVANNLSRGFSAEEKMSQDLRDGLREARERENDRLFGAGDSPSTAAPAQPVSKESNRQVLVIEDDKTFAGVVQDLVKELGFKAIWADTADEGLELAFREKPFAIVLDMKLPDHSGLFVLDLLKNDRRTRHIPVHVISVDDFSSHALRMGAMGYFLKPVKREQIGTALMEMREKFLEGHQKVLVIEDDESQRMAIRGLIEADQVQITTAATGAEGLELLSQQEFDCVVLDLSLPDTSGLHLLEKMAEDDTRKYPPVIVYTGRDLSREEEAQLKKYSRSIIVKGARSPERLLDEVSLFLHQVESALPPRQQKVLDELRSREKVLEERHLLLVDDDMRNVFALTAALEQRGAILSVARNGREAIDKLKECQKAGNPVDLVLMDVMMPVMDGYEAMREIRGDNVFKKLPIIALTAKAMKDDRERCLQAGASDYLPKPVQVDKLLSLIRVWLNAQSGLRR